MPVYCILCSGKQQTEGGLYVSGSPDMKEFVLQGDDLIYDPMAFLPDATGDDPPIIFTFKFTTLFMFFFFF